jgi:hypothetical protein
MRRKYLLWRRAFAINQLNASHYRLATMVAMIWAD